MPLLSTSANPRATPSMPSVTMKGGIAPLVMRKPLSAPVNAPIARQPAMPTHQGRSRLEVSMAPTTPDSARIEPTERSIPAEQMTKVMPIASTPNTEVDRRILRTLETERKALDSAAITAQSTTRTSSDSTRIAAPPTMRWRHDGDAAGVVVEAIDEMLLERCELRRPSALQANGRPAEAYFTNCSSGSLLASITSLVKTSVGT